MKLISGVIWRVKFTLAKTNWFSKLTSHYCSLNHPKNKEHTADVVTRRADKNSITTRGCVQRSWPRCSTHCVIHWISTKLLLLGCWCQSLWCYCRVLPPECITEPLIRPVILNWVHQHAAYVHISLSMLSFSVFFSPFFELLNYKTWEHFLEKQACEDYSCWQAGRRIAQSLFKNKTYTLHALKISQDSKWTT